MYFFLFCVISPNSTALKADYITVVEDRPIISAKYRLPVIWPKLSHAAVATVKLVVELKQCTSTSGAHSFAAL